MKRPLLTELGCFDARLVAEAVGFVVSVEEEVVAARLELEAALVESELVVLR